MVNEKKIELNPDFWFDAIKKGSLEMVKFLVEKNIVPNNEKFPSSSSEDPYIGPLYECVEYNKNEIAEFINDNLIKDKELYRKLLDQKNNNMKYYGKLGYDYILDEIAKKDYDNLFSHLCDNDYPFFASLIVNEVDVELCQELLVKSIVNRNAKFVKILLTKPNIDVNFCYTYIYKQNCLMEFFYVIFF